MHIVLHVIRLTLAVGVLIAAGWNLRDPKRYIPFAGASAIIFFLLCLGQLLGIAKDAVGLMDGLVLIVMGVACGLILSESIRRLLAKGGEDAPANGVERLFLR